MKVAEVRFDKSSNFVFEEDIQQEGNSDDSDKDSCDYKIDDDGKSVTVFWFKVRLKGKNKRKM